MAAATSKGACHACVACCRGCAAGMASSHIVTMTFVVLAGLATLGSASYSLAERSNYPQSMTTWRTLQGAITCAFAVAAAYGVARKSSCLLWMSGLVCVVSGLIFFIVMCIDADSLAKVRRRVDLQQAAWVAACAHTE